MNKNCHEVRLCPVSLCGSKRVACKIQPGRQAAFTDEKTNRNKNISVFKTPKRVAHTLAIRLADCQTVICLAL